MAAYSKVELLFTIAYQFCIVPPILMGKSDE